jgi:hypothetical protein
MEGAQLTAHFPKVKGKVKRSKVESEASLAGICVVAMLSSFSIHP